MAVLSKLANRNVLGFRFRLGLAPFLDGDALLVRKFKQIFVVRCELGLPRWRPSQISPFPLASEIALLHQWRRSEARR